MEIGASVSAGDALLVILLGVLLGTLGQFARTLGEVADPQSALNARGFGINVLTAAVVGATAGGIGAVTFAGEDLTSADLLAMVAAGYVGTDFVSQFLKRQFGSLRNP